LTGTTAKDVVDELNQLAVASKQDVHFTTECVKNFLEKCGAAYSLYQQDLVRKTLAPVVDVIREATGSVARLVKAATKADNDGDFNKLLGASRELHQGLRLLAELEKKLETRPITVQMVNAIIVDIADQIEHAEDVPAQFRRRALTIVADALPRVGQLSGATNATKALTTRPNS